MTGKKLLSAAVLFQCKKCGDCCVGYGGTYVTETDIGNIAGFTNISPEEIRSSYCMMSGKRPVLAQGPDGRCIFWDEICRIHPVKPRMCRAWPFIESVLIDVENWRIMAGQCPGIRTDFSDDLIRESVAAIIRGK